ncbi:hypothetical protein ACE3MZ_21795 [Paenibacillus sp. WLX1005]
MAIFTVNDEQQVMLQNDEDHSRIVCMSTPSWMAMCAKRKSE